MFLFTLADSTVPYKPPLDLEAWMEQYGTELLRLCYLYIKDHQLAEDAVQDTFVKAYTKYDSFRGNSSIKTWLTAIAINVCRDIMRRRSYHERPLMLSQDETDPALAMDRHLAGTQPEDPLAATDDRLMLLKAISELPDAYRETILLYYYNGFNIKEIAAIQHCAQPTVNVRLKRGRDLLKAAIGGDGKDE
ncbi:MAG: sigma-70 family RNA polymerase sigma factor [Ruminococcaceae bacterium]|nr:sigma-70 family RNA polymerase sigma factor [Oscillospiraceae bacterium]